MKKLIALCLVASTFGFNACKQKCTLNCQNGAECKDGVPTYGNPNSGYYCDCGAGFGGSTCQTRYIDKFLGNYKGGGFCPVNAPFNFSVAQLATGNGGQFKIGPISSDFIRYYPVGDSLSFNINSQTVSIDTTSGGNGGLTSLTVAGTGVFIKDTLKLRLTNPNCNSKFIRQ
jgi:hypothetical protein